MKLAPAKPRDAHALGRIMAAWIDEAPYMPKIHTPEADEQYLMRLITDAEVLTLRSWRGPQGFMARDGAIIHALYLAPGARSLGWGKKMLDHAKTASPELSLWLFQANTRARAFYAREGFAEVEMTDGEGNDEKVPDVRLVWTRQRAKR